VRLPLAFKVTLFHKAWLILPIRNWNGVLSSGLTSFLQGRPPEPVIEYRGPEVPDPPVDNLEELIARIETSKLENREVDTETEKPPEAKRDKSDEIDISKLDIRVGIIKNAWEHEEADKLFCEEIDIGEETPRRIASGLRAHYSVEELPGQRVLVLSNLKARKLVGFESHGMVLCASNDEGNVKFVEPPDEAAVGERVIVAGFDGEPATENQIIKKKMLETIFPDLRTDADGLVTFRGVPLSTRAGPCKPSLPNAIVS
jgi:aminoacyl tRNA synthase complex-interacting multifunctional protein 1